MHRTLLNFTFDANLKTFQTTMTSAEGIKLADETFLLKDKLDRAVTEIITLVKQEEQEEAIALMKNGDFENTHIQIESNYHQMMDLKLKVVKETAIENAASANTSITMTIIMLSIGVVIAILLGFFIASTIKKPLNKLDNIRDQNEKTKVTAVQKGFDLPPTKRIILNENEIGKY